jgi:hypothetical protein
MLRSQLKCALKISIAATQHKLKWKYRTAAISLLLHYVYPNEAVLRYRDKLKRDGRLPRTGPKAAHKAVLDDTRVDGERTGWRTSPLARTD